MSNNPCPSILPLRPCAIGRIAILLAFWPLYFSAESARGATNPPDRPAWAASAGSDEFGHWADMKIDKVTQRFRFIDRGEFTMGAPADESRAAAVARKTFSPIQATESQRSVRLTRAFWMADTPCTTAMYGSVTGLSPSNFTGNDQLPVENVSWDAARDYCVMLNARLPTNGVFRLPTEAEWEYACRAGTGTATYVGDLVYDGDGHSALLDRIAWYEGNSVERGRYGTWPVKSKKANPKGLYDMLGNVREWCSDWLADYPTGSVVDPLGPPAGQFRVARGGSFCSEASECRAASRSGGLNGANDIGFRVVWAEVIPK